MYCILFRGHILQHEWGGHNTLGVGDRKHSIQSKDILTYVMYFFDWGGHNTSGGG